MNGSLSIFSNRQEMLKYINSHYNAEDFLMTKRNTPYGKCFGYQNDYSDDMIGFASISVDDGEMHIYTFEISDEYKGEGYGREFFEDLVEFYKPKYVTLDPLDNEAESFWKHLGFKWEPMEHEYMIKNY